jgi:hypothetical protein
MGLWPTQGDENATVQQLLSLEAPRSPCHPDRSAAQWRDLRFGGSFLEMLFESPSRDDSNLSHPSPLVIPTEA